MSNVDFNLQIKLASVSFRAHVNISYHMLSHIRYSSNRHVRLLHLIHITYRVGQKSEPQTHDHKGKGKVFPYSFSSVGPGADPGVQAVRLTDLTFFTGRFLGEFVVKWILKLPPHLAYVGTLPCETLMSAKQAVNDKLQGSVAIYLRCGGFACALRAWPTHH